MDASTEMPFVRSVIPPRSFCVSAARSSGLITSKSSETDSTPGSGNRCSRDLVLEARAERAAGDGERDRDGDVPALDAHLAHHVELRDGPLQLGIDDLPERLGDLLAAWAAPRFERSSGPAGTEALP